MLGDLSLGSDDGTSEVTVETMESETEGICEMGIPKPKHKEEAEKQQMHWKSYENAKANLKNLLKRKSE